MVKNMLTFIAYCLIAGALIFLTRASEMPLKALVGQYLLDNVWKKTLHSGTQTKPWASKRAKGRQGALGRTGEEAGAPAQILERNK